MGGYERIWTEVDGNGRKRTKLDRNGLKLAEIDQNGQIGQKWTAMN